VLSNVPLSPHAFDDATLHHGGSSAASHDAHREPYRGLPGRDAPLHTHDARASDCAVAATATRQDAIQATAATFIVISLPAKDVRDVWLPF